MWTIAKNGFRECLRYRVVYYIFAMALLFILMGKGCNPGAIKGNDLFLMIRPGRIWRLPPRFT